MNSKLAEKMAEADLISTINWVKHTELTLDRVVQEVWPVFRDMRRWYTEYSFEVLSGPAYLAGSGLLEGQVLKVKSSMGLPKAPDADDVAGPQYLIVKTIKVDPQKEIVAVLSGCAYDWRQFTSFYVWSMTENAGKTTIFVDAYGQAEMFKPLSKGECTGYEDELTKNWHRSWSEAFMNLQKVVNEVN
jgi:hypothetical protein